MKAARKRCPKCGLRRACEHKQASLEKFGFRLPLFLKAKPKQTRLGG